MKLPRQNKLKMREIRERDKENGYRLRSFRVNDHAVKHGKLFCEEHGIPFQDLILEITKEET